MLTEKNSKFLLWIGIILFFAGIGIFIRDENFNFAGNINTNKISGFGDFIGGTIGSIWSLAGVILFYVALTEQREDIKINRNALNAQVEALNQQIREFELQRTELEETRKVFEEQGETLRVQRFENTFFQLVNLHHEIIDKLNFDRKNFRHGTDGIEKREVISKAVMDLIERIELKNSISQQGDFGEVQYLPNEPKNLDEAKERLYTAYREFYFEEYKQLLSHYYRNIYHIFKFIYTTTLIEENKKQFYASLVRAQLSSDELLLIAYNSIIPDLGYPNFLFLIERFDIMQNFDFDLIYRFKYHEEIFVKTLKNFDSDEIKRKLKQ
tara:strand:- start:32607 stop:33581 length:975 start_codon:yes stop_codon:yes gene_type:complete